MAGSKWDTENLGSKGLPAGPTKLPPGLAKPSLPKGGAHGMGGTKGPHSGRKGC